MGNIFFKKDLSNIEKLESIEEKIQHIHIRQKMNIQKKKSYSNKFTFVSIVITVTYIYYKHLFEANKTNFHKFILFINFFVFIFIIYGIRKFIQWLFSSKYIKNESLLLKLQEEKSFLMEEIMEREPYKKVRDLMEKFETDHQIIKSITETPSTSIGLRKRIKFEEASSPSQDLKLPNSFDQSSFALPMQSISPSKNLKLKSANQAHLDRTLIKAQRSVFDRIIDIFMGDGPENSFALICKKCFTHNGLAYKDQYTSICYYCVNCGFLNENITSNSNANPIQESTTENSTNANCANKINPLVIQKPETKNVRHFLDQCKNE